MFKSKGAKKGSKNVFSSFENINDSIEILEQTTTQINAEAIEENESLRTFIDTLLAIVKQGLNVKETVTNFLATVCKNDVDYNAIFQASVLQSQLDQAPGQEFSEQAVESIMWSSFIRGLMSQGLTSQFIQFCADLGDKIANVFYEEETGVFLNPEIQENVLNQLAPFEDENSAITFSIDYRFYNELSEESQQFLNKSSELLEQLLEKTYINHLNLSQQELLKYFKSLMLGLKVPVVIQLFEMLAEQLTKIIKGKEAINQEFQNELAVEFDNIDQIFQQLQSVLQTLADCGLKLKSKKTKAQVNFGEAVSKELIISLLLQNPLLLTIFLAYLGGNLESDKYLCQQFLIKNFDPKAENRMLLSSGFCSRLSKVVYQQLSEKSIVNVSRYGGYYSNYWTNIQGMLLDSPYGQDILDGLLEHTCNTLMTRQAEGDDIEVLLFMCLQNILEQFERNNAKLYPWFKKQQIQNKNEILQQIEAPDATEDELGYKLLFFLFKHKNLHILCDEDSHRIKKIVNQLQDDFTLPESYTSSEYIQQRRIIFVQLTFNLFTKSLNQFCMIHSEQVISSEIGQFMKQIARQAFDYVSQVTEDPMYITELMKEHNLTKEVDKFQDYLLCYMGQDTGISKNAERLLTLLAQIQVDKQYKGAAMNSFFSNMANVLQSQFVGNDIVLMFNNLLMSLLPPAKKGVQQQPTKYLKLYYLMQLVQNYSDEDDKREAFIRGLFLTSSLNDLCDCVSENIDYFRRYYQYNSQFLKQDFQNKMSTIAETIQLKDIHFDSVSKKIHSSIDNNEVLEDVQSDDEMPPEDFPAPEEVPEQVNDDVPTELPEVQEEPIVEEQIVQKENVEEPVPEFVENMPSLNGFEAVAQAQQESNQNGEEYKDLESHENEHNDTQQQAAALEESTKHNEEPHEPEHVAEGHEENTSHQENAHDAINVPEEKQECQDELINDIPTDLPLISAQDQEEVIHSTQHQEQAPDLNCDHTDTINEPEAPQENAQQEIEQNNVVEENNHIIEEAKQFEIEHNDSMDKHTVEDQKDDMPPEDFPAPEEVPEQVNDDVPTELPEVQEEPIVEEQIVQKENVEEPVPEFVENMPSLNGFEAVAQAQQESNQNGEEYKDLESHENEHNDTQQQAAALEESTKHNEEPHEPEHVAEGHEENTSHQENAHDAINVPEEKQECQDELINDIPTDLPLISAQDQEEVIHSTQHQEQAPDLNCDHTDTINEPEAPQENAQQEIEQNNVVEENNHIIEEAKQFEIEHNDSMDKHTVEDQKDDMPPEDFPAPEEVPEQVNDDVPTELPEVQEEPIVEEQIVQKENVEEPVPEFVENMPSLNGFEAVAQAQQESNQNGEEYKDLESHENEHNDTQQQAAALEESTKHNEEPHEPEHVAEGHEENTSHQENAHDAINVPEEKQECQDELINDIPTDLPLISAQDQEEVIHSTQHQEQAPDLNCDHTDTINEPEAPQENAQQEIEQNNVVEENNHIIEEAKQFEIEHNDSMDKHTVEDQKDDMPPEDFPAPEEVPEQVNDDVPTELPEVQEDHGHVEQEQIEQYTVNSQEQLVSTKQVFAQFSSKKVYEESEELPDNSLLLSHIASGPKDIDSIMDTQVDVKSLLNIKNLVNADGTSNKQLKKALTDDIKALLSGNGSLQEQIKELMEKELAEEEIHCTFENELVLFKKLTDIGKMYKQTKDSNKQFMQNGKLTMGNLLNFIEPTPIQLNSELTEFLTKCNKIFAKTQMQTAKLVFSPNKTSSPLDLAACNLLQALYEQDTNPECQTQTCCCCSSNMTNYQYQYLWIEKSLTNPKFALSACNNCLRIGHKICLYKGVCKDCQEQ
ncbi:Conserved_hypothetical protein [Hexamita inflata]|uniref:Uncharacterized protein n=1 Tax=Hexamita inflata TaxID=28002 RepID=A0AA86PFV7_9EUKA|nr:Conserved hypothetical protein [Hexamita inflata]